MLSPGQDVICAGGSEIYIGRITNNELRYIKMQAVNLKTSTTIDLKFYKNELTFIAPLKQNQILSDDTSSDFTFEDLKKVSKMLTDYVFIQQFDKKYYDAIADIESESFIGLYIPGVAGGRFSERTIIACSTSKSIYIFDVMVLGRIHESIKNVLEANVPKKIIHDSCGVADYLKHKENINLNGVFDTMVAHCSLGYDKERYSLAEVLHDHFKLPEQFLDGDTKKEWHLRPLESNEKSFAAQSVIFLRTLKNHFCQKMLKDLCVNELPQR